MKLWGKTHFHCIFSLQFFSNFWHCLKICRGKNADLNFLSSQHCCKNSISSSWWFFLYKSVPFWCSSRRGKAVCCTGKFVLPCCKDRWICYLNIGGEHFQAGFKECEQVMTYPQEGGTGQLWNVMELPLWISATWE